MTANSHLFPILAALGTLSALPGAARAESLTVEEAIRSAWAQNPALLASAAGVEAARAEAARARDSRLPSISLGARAARTDEPMMAFGMKLDQARIGPSDFDPARLNHPSPVSGIGASASLNLPIFMGGRLLAGQRAAAGLAEAEASDDRRRRQEIATSVVEAYFGAQASEEGLRYAEEVVAHARETERFLRQRNQQGLALDADVARAAAFRAQAEAERALAAQRQSSARSALELLAGAGAAEATLATPLSEDLLDLPLPAAGSAPDRPDLRAARLREEAARAGVAAARGSLLPSLAAQATAETLRTPGLDQGGKWITLGVVASWELSVAGADATRAAGARARAAAEDLTWRQRQAAREVAEARRAAGTADARIRAAQDAVEASASARTLRDARYRQGLLPLTDLLDAEAGLAGARALLLASRLEARVARARLALALDLPIEGQTP